jgi:hypothetical protein
MRMLMRDADINADVDADVDTDVDADVDRGRIGRGACPSDPS